MMLQQANNWYLRIIIIIAWLLAYAFDSSPVGGGGKGRKTSEFGASMGDLVHSRTKKKKKVFFCVICSSVVECLLIIQEAVAQPSTTDAKPGLL